MKIIGKERLHDLGFDIIVEGKLSAQQATMVNKVEEDLPSTSDLAEADNMELQKITEKAARSMDNLIEELEDTSSETLPMHEIKAVTSCSTHKIDQQEIDR